MLHRDEAKASNQPLQSYAPVVKALLTLDEGEKLKVMRKFYISYMLAREGIAFKKSTQIQALEMRHGVQLGSSYKWPDSSKVFTHFIAESQRQQFLHSMSGNNFFSFLMDGSTDCS